MLNRIIKSGLLMVLLSFLCISDASGEELSIDGRGNYLILKKIYDKWDSGLYGSRKLYRNRLNRLLADMTGYDIITGRDYTISIPDVFEKQYYSSDLYNQNWLHIHGPADNQSIKEFA